MRHTPGLHLHTSNRLETLAAGLAEVTSQPLSSPFRAEAIVVQSQGMARWIKQRLADVLGVCANVSFPFPNEFASGLFLALFPELPAKPPFDRDVMLWLVMKHLPALLDEPAFDDPGRYLANRADLRQRYQLARKIAHLFDQYFIFRPDLIRAWDQHEDPQWQAQLWRRIRADIPHRHPAELHEAVAGLLQRPGLDGSRLPERLSIFGISALPPFHLELFTALGAHLPVRLFVVEPSRHYWGDITSGREEERLLKRHRRDPADAAALHLECGNRLLASLGPLGRDFLKLIYSSGDWQEHDRFSEPEANTLLTHLQSDILNLRDRGRDETPPQTISSDDDSIHVHSCHSPLREMEVLQDHLLDWFNRDPLLAPRDIVVMVPNIEDYTPFIEAVFGSPEDESRRIPFRIADRGARQASQLIQVFLALLHLPQTRLGAATVLALLENRAVQNRFSLSENDIELARHWIEETRIRWGAGAEHRARLELPALPDNTWRAGIDRLLLGYAMGGDGKAMFDGIVPYDDLEGDPAPTLGRLAGFIERLFDTVTDLGQTRSLRDWSARLRRLLDDFMQPDEDNERDHQHLRAALDALTKQHELSRFDDPVDLGVILEHLTPELEQDHHGAAFLSGGVTFCALKPMRSIPFKVVCLAGMNDAVFPRPNAHLSFDLMARSPRLGDRSTRNDDRYLFLETILSSRERFYLSYVGQSLRDNGSIPPSVVVSELLDYLERGFNFKREQLVTRHRLQAFHEAYFRTGTGLFSYSVENCRASQSARHPAAIRGPFLGPSLGEPEPDFRLLTLEDLGRFLCNPAAGLLERRLRLRLRQVAGALEDREAFDLDARDAYSLRQELLDDRIDGVESTQTLEQIAARGVLPLGRVGRARSRSISAAVESFWQRLSGFEPHRTGSAIDLDLTLAGFRLTGRIIPRADGGLLSYRAASVKPQDILRLWIQHLAAQVNGHHVESVLVGTDATHRYRPCENALELLHAFLELYWQGLCRPLKFFPRSSLAFVKAEEKSASGRKSRVTPLDEALREWEGIEFGLLPPERDDPAYNLCFGDTLPLDEEFTTLARRVFAPIIQHETVEEA
jgi:exodeoxyribonuclease V gamma subunit